MRSKLITIIFLFISGVSFAQIGGNIRLMQPADGEGYIIYTDTSGRQDYVLLTSLIDDTTGLDVRIDSVSFDTVSRDLTLYYNDTSITNLTINIPGGNIETSTDTIVSLSNLQMFGIQPVVVNNDTVGIKVEMSRSGGEFGIMETDTGQIEVIKRGLYVYLNVTRPFNADSLSGQDSTYYLHYLDPTIAGVRDTLITIDNRILVLEGDIVGINDWDSLVNVPAGFADGIDDNTTYSAGAGLTLNTTTFSLTDVSNQASVDNSGNTFIQDITLDGFGFVTGITSAALSSHSHTESDISDLDHFTGADITGNETAFTGWDKDVTDDFSGDYNDLTNKPTIGVSRWNLNTNHIYNNNTGNVGIGEFGPSQKLHVNGNFRLTGALYDALNSPGGSGQILSSTVTGTDWIDPYTADGTTIGKTVGNQFYLIDPSSQISINNSGLNFIQDVTLDNYGRVTSLESNLVSIGSGLSLLGQTISLTDVSSQTSVNNSGNTFIQDIILDGFGRVTGIVSSTATYTSYDYWRITADNNNTENVTRLELIDFAGGKGIKTSYNTSTNTLQTEVSNDVTVIANASQAFNTYSSSSPNYIHTASDNFLLNDNTDGRTFTIYVHSGDAQINTISGTDIVEDGNVIDPAVTTKYHTSGETWTYIYDSTFDYWVIFK